MKKNVLILGFLVVAAFMMSMTQCGSEAVSSSGVTKATASVVVGTDGLTVEQRNITRRLEMENVPGKIQFLYILSAYSGDIIMYSTVKGKVTSSSKRLTPTMIEGHSIQSFTVKFGDTSYYTNEVLGDDGTYDGGGSTQYVYWWDVQDRYHQQFIQGGMILHISDKPLTGINKVGINLSPSE
jgi:hypothetical protein